MSIAREVRDEWRRRSWPGRAAGVLTAFIFAWYVLFWGAVGLLIQYAYMLRGTSKEERKDVFWLIRAAAAEVRGDEQP